MCVFVCPPPPDCSEFEKWSIWKFEFWDFEACLIWRFEFPPCSYFLAFEERGCEWSIRVQEMCQSACPSSGLRLCALGCSCIVNLVRLNGWK